MNVKTNQLLLITAVTFLSQLAQKPAVAQPGGPAFVVVARAVEKELAEGRTYISSVVPSRKAKIGSAVDGRVDVFSVNEGDRVKKGTALAELLKSTIKSEHKAADARLQMLRDELKELENGSRPQEIAQAKASMEAREAASDYLKKRLARLEELRKKSITTADEIQEVESAYLAANKRLDESKAMYEMVKEGPRKEDIIQKVSEVEEQLAIVDKLADQITKHTIVTKFDGYITEEFTEEGAWVNRGDPIVTVVALDEIDLLTNVIESDITKLKIGMSARVDIGALPDRVWTGTVHAIIPEADPRSRTFPVKIRMDNVFVDADNKPCDPNETLKSDGSDNGETEKDKKNVNRCQPLVKSGMLAKVTLSLGKKQNVLLVPKDALVLGGEKKQLWVVNGKSEDVKSSDPNATGLKQAAVKKIDVTLGIAEGNWIQVTGDIQDGDLVVTEGNERIFAPMVTWDPKNEKQFEEPKITKSKSANN